MKIRLTTREENGNSKGRRMDMGESNRNGCSSGSSMKMNTMRACFKCVYVRAHFKST